MGGSCLAVGRKINPGHTVWGLEASHTATFVAPPHNPRASCRTFSSVSSMEQR